MEIKKYVPKLIIPPGLLDTKSFGISPDKDLITCEDCGSHLIYIKKSFGIVEESNFYHIMGNKSKRVYSLREIGFTLFCAECGGFIESYSKYFYPEDLLVYCFDNGWYDLDEDEKVEVEYCLSQFNQTRDFIPRYKFAELNKIKEALLEYEKKHKEKNEKDDGKTKKTKN